MNSIYFVCAPEAVPPGLWPLVPAEKSLLERLIVTRQVQPLADGRVLCEVALSDADAADLAEEGIEMIGDRDAARTWIEAHRELLLADGEV